MTNVISNTDTSIKIKNTISKVYIVYNEPVYGCMEIHTVYTTKEHADEAVKEGEKLGYRMWIDESFLNKPILDVFNDIYKDEDEISDDETE